uniref:Aldose 1-epimerase n=2 Tax=Dendroctonus ponderosae TaxID=77166 RepID=A0AAR5QFZ8_DENPD
MSCPRPVPLTIDAFGSLPDQSGAAREVKRFTWTNSKRTTVQVINYGATITSIQLLDNAGHLEDVVTGFDHLEQYLGPDNRFFGATVGRVANRIAAGKFGLAGREYSLAKNNNGVNHLHGGVKGFDKVLWNYHVKGSQLVLTYLSPDLEEGYPGDVLVTVTFELTEANELRIDYRAVASKPTPINLTNHSYFNLAGHGAGPAGLYEHAIQINASQYTELGATLIPTGKLLDVAGTELDFRQARRLGDVINRVPNAKGFDFNYCISNPPGQMGLVMRAVHPPSGRGLELHCDQPGVQFYTGNALPEGDEIRGKRGAIYRKHGAFCIETQKYPDAVNQAHFPSTILYPGEQYRHVAVFKFTLDTA